MPLADYTHFALTLNTKWADKPTWESCDVTNNTCRFSTSCEEVRADI